MAVVLVLFLFGAANSASIFLNPHVAHGPVKHMPSSAPSAEYISLENLLGSAVTYTQDQVAEAQSVHITGPQAVIEEAVAVPSVKNAEPEPFLVSGPVAEYVIPFGLNIPGIQFNDEALLQPASVPTKTASVPKVVEYSLVPKAEPVVENYYNVDDGHFEMVNPTYVTYDSLGSAPVNTDPVSSLLNTFVKVDDGQLEQFNLLQFSNSAQELVSVYDQTPVLETYAAPTLADLSESIIYGAPEPVVFNSNIDVEVEFYNNPVLAISNMLKSFNKKAGGNIEEIAQTHLQYNIPEQVATPSSFLTNVPFIEMIPNSGDIITYSSNIVAPVPVVKTKAKLPSKSISSYKEEEVDTDIEKVEVKINKEVVNHVEEEEEKDEETIIAETKSEGEETSGDEAEIKSEGLEEEEDEGEEITEYSRTTKKEEDSDED